MRTLSIAEVLTIIRRVKMSVDIYHVEMTLYPDCEQYLNLRG